MVLQIKQFIVNSKTDRKYLFQFSMMSAVITGAEINDLVIRVSQRCLRSRMNLAPALGAYR